MKINVIAEYGMGGKASVEGDVYSFGILILEIFIARRPTDQMFNDDYNLHNFVKTALPDRLVEIADCDLLSREVEETTSRGGINRNIAELQHKIIETGNLNPMTAKTRNCLLSVLEIGLSCSSESPKERANMNDATRELQLTKMIFSATDEVQGILITFLKFYILHIEINCIIYNIFL